MKKILFLIPNLAHGGAEKVLVNLVNNMDSKLFDITVQVLFDTGVNKQFLKPHIKYKYCMKHQFRGNSKVLKLFSPEFLFKHFIKEKYDIIVSYLEGPTARIVSGCTDKDTKLVSWIHCTYKSIESASYSFRDVQEAKKCYNRFDYTAFVSKAVGQGFVKVFDFKKPCGVVYNTIETKAIEEKSLEKIDDIVFKGDEINICSVGKIIPVKGYMRLAHIHKRLLDLGIKNHVYILGLGEEKDSIQKWLYDNKLQKSFTFLGFRENPYKYVKACDLFVCSSLSEGFSTAVTESLIVGTPVVTTLCSGMKEALGENNEYGIVTDNNEEDLFEGIKHILQGEGLLDLYAQKAKERGSFFSTENTVRATEEMFLSL